MASRGKLNLHRKEYRNYNDNTSGGFRRGKLTSDSWQLRAIETSL